ncbi:hypothetical protein Bca4012_059666 [Brassica carinata]
MPEAMWTIMVLTEDNHTKIETSGTASIGKSYVTSPWGENSSPRFASQVDVF